MLVRMMNFLSIWVIPLVVVSVILFALYRRVNVFEVFVEGAKEGFQMAVHLIPYLVGMMVAIGLFKDSGAMDLIIRATSPLLTTLRIPPEILPLAIMRPMSGSGALAITTEILHASGPDSLLGRIASTMQGSTETTLYVLTVYFGAVGINKTRHTLAVGLLADFTGFIVAVTVCRLAFG